MTEWKEGIRGCIIKVTWRKNVSDSERTRCYYLRMTCPHTSASNIKTWCLQSACVVYWLLIGWKQCDLWPTKFVVFSPQEHLDKHLSAASAHGFLIGSSFCTGNTSDCNTQGVGLSWRSFKLHGWSLSDDTGFSGKVARVSGTETKRCTELYSDLIRPPNV